MAPAPNNTTLRIDRLFPGQYDNTKYKATASDPDGISRVRMAYPDGTEFLSGFPTCPSITQIDTGTMTWTAVHFPITAYVNDCKDLSTTYTVQAGMPPLP